MGNEASQKEESFAAHKDRNDDPARRSEHHHSLQSFGEALGNVSKNDSSAANVGEVSQLGKAEGESRAPSSQQSSVQHNREPDRLTQTMEAQSDLRAAQAAAGKLQEHEIKQTTGVAVGNWTPSPSMERQEAAPAAESMKDARALFTAQSKARVCSAPQEACSQATKLTPVAPEAHGSVETKGKEAARQDLLLGTGALPSALGAEATGEAEWSPKEMELPAMQIIDEDQAQEDDSVMWPFRRLYSMLYRLYVKVRPRLMQ